jgi:hypothetical protein
MEHIEKYQVVYAAVGSSVATFVVVKTFGHKPQITHIVNEAKPVFNNTVAPVISNVVNNAGYCTKVVQDLETGDLWPKAGELAYELSEKHGITYDAARTMLSRHLNGKRDQVFGKQYRTIALGTTG